MRAIIIDTFVVIFRVNITNGCRTPRIRGYFKMNSRSVKRFFWPDEPNRPHSPTNGKLNVIGILLLILLESLSCMISIGKDSACLGSCCFFSAALISFFSPMFPSIDRQLSWRRREVYFGNKQEFEEVLDMSCICADEY